MTSISFYINIFVTRNFSRISLVFLFLLAISPALAGEVGLASFYTGERTASGELYDPDGFTAAHRTLPFGSLMRVFCKKKYAVVRINDRGPHLRDSRA
jgi:rare lipoprotein A